MEIKFSSPPPQTCARNDEIQLKITPVTYDVLSYKLRAYVIRVNFMQITSLSSYYHHRVISKVSCNV